MGTSGNILSVLTEFKLVACLIVGLVAVTLALSLEAEVIEVMEMSEKAEPLPLSRDSLVLVSELELPLVGVLLLLDTLMTVFMAALLLLKSHTSMTESSSLIAEAAAEAMEAAENNSPLKGADFGRSNTGRRRRFFFIAEIGFGPENGNLELVRCKIVIW